MGLCMKVGREQLSIIHGNKFSDSANAKAFPFQMVNAIGWLLLVSLLIYRGRRMNGFHCLAHHTEP